MCNLSEMKQLDQVSLGLNHQGVMFTLLLKPKISLSQTETLHM